MPRDASLLDTLDQLPVMADALTKGPRIAFWNKTCETVTGWKRQEIVGNPDAWELLYPDSAYRASLLKQYEDADGTYSEWECMLTCKDGSQRTIAWTSAVVPEALRQAGWNSWSIGIDVTEKCRAQEELSRSEAFYRTLVNLQENPVCRWLPDTTLTFVNGAYCKLVGARAEDLLGRRWLDYIPESNRGAVETQLNKLRSCEAEKPCARYAHAVLSTAQGLRWVEWQDFPVTDETGTIVEFQSIGYDITDKHVAEREIEDADEDKLRHWGMELHDGILQQLTAASFTLKTARHLAKERPALREILEQVSALVNDSVQEAALLSRQLFPPSLIREGIKGALDALAQGIRTTWNVQCFVNVIGLTHDDDATEKGQRSIDLNTATHLFRIAQEAACNAAKHSQANRIQITLCRNDCSLELAVEDDGKGMDQNTVEGIGLKSMRRRAYLLNGTFSIGPRENKGTVVFCSVPAKEDKSHERP